MKSRIDLFIKAAKARAYVRVKGQLTRDVNWLIASVVGAFLTMATYVYLYRSVGAPKEFAGMVLLGGFMTPYWLNVLWSVAMQLYWEKEMGNLQIVMLSPAPLSAFLFGLTIGGMVHTTIRSALVLFVGLFVFKISFAVNNLFYVILVFIITLLALYGVGMIVSSLFLFYGRELWRVALLLEEPVTLASGFYFPVRFLGTLGAGIVSLIPLALGLDALRQLLMVQFPFFFLSWKIEALILVGLAVIFGFLAIKMIDYIEKISKREGKLTLKWE
jgi:ABC-2 type transport system permease protein